MQVILGLIGLAALIFFFAWLKSLGVSKNVSYQTRSSSGLADTLSDEIDSYAESLPHIPY